MKDIQSICILGRQPALGLAELERLHGSDSMRVLGNNLVGLTLDASEINFRRLGGSIKLTCVIDVLHQANWQQIEKKLLQRAPIIARDFEPGKITIGVSSYDSSVQPKAIQATALKLKKIIRSKTSQSVRVVPNQEAMLSTAQVIHNKLTGPRGIELVVIQQGDRTYITQTVAEQDIEAYTKRDQARPKRDARVGMLPPKLAQIIVNLAAGQVNPEGNPEYQDSPEKGSIQTPSLLDPFCGTGVVLQEASLMGFLTHGSDIEKRMVSYTEENMNWLKENFNPKGTLIDVSVGDATTHTWESAFNVIACEGYLGQPFSAFPTEEKLREVMQTCNQIMKGFLKNIAPQIESGTPLCVALPAWHRPNGKFEHLKLLDSLEELGYNRVSFVHVRDEDLLYYRPDQVVARELLVITRK